jgi:hypothetical protein
MTITPPPTAVCGNGTLETGEQCEWGGGYGALGNYPSGLGLVGTVDVNNTIFSSAFGHLNFNYTPGPWTSAAISSYSFMFGAPVTCNAPGTSSQCQVIPNKVTYFTLNYNPSSTGSTTTTCTATVTTPVSSTTSIPIGMRWIDNVTGAVHSSPTCSAVISAGNVSGSGTNTSAPAFPSPTVFPGSWSIGGSWGGNGGALPPGAWLNPGYYSMFPCLRPFSPLALAVDAEAQFLGYCTW